MGVHEGQGEGGVTGDTKRSITWGEPPLKVSRFAKVKKYLGHVGLLLGLIIYTAAGAWVRSLFPNKFLGGHPSKMKSHN